MPSKKRIVRTVLSAICVAVCLGWADLALAEPATKPAKEYRIKINRPEKAGQVYKVTASGTMKNETGDRDSQGASRENRKTFEFKGVRKVLKVDANGLPVSNEMTCETCIAERDGDRTEALPAGTVVLLSNENGKPKAEPKDPNVTLSFAARDPMFLTTYILPVPGLDLDAWFGTDKPRKPGESWPIHADAIKAAVQKTGDKTEGQNVTGRTTLIGLTKVDGIECLDVSIELNVSLAEPQVHGLTTMERNNTMMTFRLALPLDESIPMVSRKIKMVTDYAMKVSQPNEPERKFERKGELTVDVTSLPVTK